VSATQYHLHVTKPTCRDLRRLPFDRVGPHNVILRVGYQLLRLVVLILDGAPLEVVPLVSVTKDQSYLSAPTLLESFLRLFSRKTFFV